MTQSLLRECRDRFGKHSNHYSPGGAPYFAQDCPLCNIIKRLDAAIDQAEAPVTASAGQPPSNYEALYAYMKKNNLSLPVDKALIRESAPDGLPPDAITAASPLGTPMVKRADYDALRTVAVGLARRVGESERKPLAYLAAPYSHPDRTVRVARFDAINKEAAKLMSAGLLIYSPISHTHPIAEAGDLPLGWDFWRAYDTAFIEHSGKLIVLMLDGWRDSKGVTAEIKLAQELGCPIEYIDGQIGASGK